MTRKIKLGVTDYRELMTSNCYVIDKTLMIQEFLSQGNKTTLITQEDLEKL